MTAIRIDRKHVEFCIFAGFVLAGALGVARSLLTQDVVWVSNGLGWDGVHYDRLLKYFSGQGVAGEPAAFPFCGRIGTPWLLANVFGGNLDFYRFNLAVSALFSASFVAVTFPLWKGSLKALAAAIAIPSFLIFAPIKFTNFYPAYMDPPFMLMLGFSLFFVLRRQYHVAGLICLLAIPFREAALYLLPLFSAFAVLEAKQKIGAAALGVAMLAAGFVLKSYMLQVASCEGQSQLMTALQMLYRVISEPAKFTGAMAAVSLTLGPVLFFKRDGLSSFKLPDDRAQLFALVAVFYVGALSVAGGSDVTRIFYSFAPLYAPLLIAGFAKLDLSGFALACIGWLVTNQMLNNYAQPVAVWPNNDLAGFFAQFPDHGHPVVGIVILAAWALFRAAHGFVSDCENAVFARLAS